MMLFECLGILVFFAACITSIIIGVHKAEGILILIGIMLIGPIFAYLGDRVEQIKEEKKTPTALDVYRGKTILIKTSRSNKDTTKVDSVVIFKN